MAEKPSTELSDSQPKKPKMDAPTPATCAHFLKRKKRFCKMTVAKGNKYCGEHIPPEEAGETDEVARVPCPLDPKHTIFKKNLRKHLKICNARPNENDPAYIKRGVNAGDNEDIKDDYANLKLADLSKEELQAIIDKVKHLHEKYVKGKITNSNAQLHKSLNEELSKAEYGKETRKHLLQTAALLGILNEEEQLKPSTSFIEFGAGKGQLAYYLAKLLDDLTDSKVILLDRMSLRHKKDNKIEDRNIVQRIRVDIADFNMPSLELLRTAKRKVAFSKHLCGAATDLTLRCITQANEAKCSTDFIMIALCCHHRCEWRSFVGKDFFKLEGLTQRDFVIITKMVGWAICGTGMSRERRALEAAQTVDLGASMKTATHGLTLAERSDIGFMCKRILDVGRLKYLEKHNFEACLKSYVANDITLENVCLLAKMKEVS